MTEREYHEFVQERFDDMAVDYRSLGDNYTELKNKHKKLEKLFWSVFIIFVVSIVWDSFTISGKQKIIDRYNYSEVIKTTAYTLHYSECGKMPGHKEYGITATGTRAMVGRTVAVDPNYIPLGTKIYVMQGIMIQGKKYFEFVAEDTGNKVKGRMIDFYFGEPGQHKYAENYGAKNLLIYTEAQ